MSTYNKPELEALWATTNPGNGNPHTMAAIALAESSGNSSSVNSIGACGLWQIHPYEAGCLNPVTNAMQAGKKLRSQGLGAWETYTNGAYRQYLGGSQGATSGTANALFGIPGTPPLPGEGPSGLGFGTPLEELLKGGVPGGGILSVPEKFYNLAKALSASFNTIYELFFTPAGWVRLGKLGIGVTLLLVGIFGLANVGVVETAQQGAKAGKKAGVAGKAVKAGEFTAAAAAVVK